MTHNEMVHGLCTQETITVQDFAELIRFTLDANEEVISTDGLTSTSLSGSMQTKHLALI